MQKILIFLLINVFIIGCSSSSNLFTLNETQNYINQQFEDSLFAHAHWGVLIESLKTGEIWYEQNADRMFMPASNQKIPTTAAALLTLGPNFTFETHLYYTGEIIDSVLAGDLIVKGNGDPTFYTRFFEDPRDPFYSWADTLLKMGIKKIDGNIVGDDNTFDDQHYGYGWTLSGLPHWWSAEVGALQFNENYIDIEFIQPKSLQDSVEIIPNVKSDYFNIVNNLTVVDTGKTSISFDRPYGTNDIIVSGNIVTGEDTLERSPSIWNPTMFFTTVLKETFINNGIQITGKAIDCDEIPFWHFNQTDSLLLLTHFSPPLKDIIKFLMKKSQNMYAETMVRIMGLMNSGIGSFAEGEKVVERVLSDFGIEPDNYSYADGSGLSRYNFTSPRNTVKILKSMRNSEYWEIWKDILPIAGIDGTLKRRMIGTKAEGNVRAKTGTISNVRGLSGYLQTADGEDIVFSFLINGHLRTSRETELITDSVLKFIAEYPNKRKL